MILDEFFEHCKSNSKYKHSCPIIIKPDGDIEEVIMGHGNKLREIAMIEGSYYDPPVHENYYAHLLNMTKCISVDYDIQFAYHSPTKEQIDTLKILNMHNLIDLNLHKLNF